MSDMNQTGTVAAKGTIRALKLNRETLRELDAGGLRQAQGERQTSFCDSERRCTQGCGPFTKKC
jgi:hypothetical protein